MEFKLNSTDTVLKEAFTLLLQDCGYSYGDNGISISLHRTDKQILKVVKSGKEASVLYHDPVHFFRGVGQILAHCTEEHFEKTETVYMDHLGVMLDCSRNAVPTVTMLKSIIRVMALLGMNQLFLYMEDLYEIPEYPYFGALRGRYSKEELKDCDKYACMYGVELIPCIQTLAHLGTFLRWEEHSDLRDTPENLLPDEDQVYVLIDTMLRSVSECFSSNKIHLGMDEAHGLGLGNYLNKHGFTDRLRIMKNHLDKVEALCKKYELEPMIWSDMYFKLISEDSSYYNLPEEAEWPEEEKPGENLTLVYWDYYSHEPETYERMLHLHRKLSDKIYFAGGAWTWNGLAPNYKFAFDRTQSAMQVMKEQDVRNCFLTIWMDDGGETPFSTGLLPMLLFAEEGFSPKTENEELDRMLHLLHCGSLEEWMLLGEFDYLTDFDPCEEKSVNPSKALFYQDPMLGLFDKQYDAYDLCGYYGELAEKLSRAEEHIPGDLFGCYKALAEFLAVKGSLGSDLRNAYLAADRKSLENIVNKRIPECMNKLRQYHSLREKVWFEECKPNGYEVLDIRMGGIRARLESTQKRIGDFLRGEIDTLPELEEQRLPFSGKKTKSNISVLCNEWDHIVTAGNISGERL